MRAVDSETNTPKHRSGTRPGARSTWIRKARVRSVTLESLESRTLMAVIPPAIVNGQTVVSPGGTKSNQSSPSIAVDPTNAQHLVSVWTLLDTNRSGDRFNPQVVAEGAVSSNGGTTWTTFTPATVLTDPTSDVNNPALFAQTTDASVDFDRNGNFYVVVSEHKADNTSGAILLNKFAFTNPNNPTVNNEVLYAWTRDQALKPTLAVDKNVASYSDPATGVTQTDVSAGNVYVAWATNDTVPPNTGNWNPNAIRMIASSDGANSFSGFKTINVGGNFGAQRQTAPRLAISQGSATVTGGQVSIVYDDFGSGSNANPPVDLIKANTIPAGVQEKTFTNAAGGPIFDAPAANVATSTPYPINVTSGLTGTISDLSVNVTLTDANLGNLSLDLLAPDGFTRVPLAQVGKLTGTNMGFGTGGKSFGTTFEQSAAGSILDAPAPYVGTFRPIGNLSALNGQAVQTGPWQLIATVSTTGSAGFFRDASLTFTTGLTPRGEITATTTTVRGAQGISYPTASAATPFGIGPSASLASDNTLGSFSPNEGRLYLTYVNRSTATGNPADNTDVFVRTSDDGGTTWSTPVRVNDDIAVRDGFSEGDRAQFDPAAAVDPANGTLIITYYDGRYDAARARLATTIAASIDGGKTFGTQAFANAPFVVTDQATGGARVLGPILDNNSAGNTAANADRALFGMGDRLGLAVLAGQIYPAWSSNLNGGLDGTMLLNTTVARATFAAGPRVISGTMGPVGVSGDSLNNTTAADGGPQAHALIVTFDRPVDPASFTAAQVTIIGRDANGNLLPAIVPSAPVPVASTVTAFGATQFQVNFPAQSTPGTYSYAIGPLVQDRVRQVSPAKTGNTMDQNGNAVTGQGNSDRFAVPTPTGNVPFVAPFALNSLPLIVPGPHVVSSTVPGATGADNLVLNNTASAIDVTFDRDMDPTSFGIPAGTPVGTTITGANVPVLRIQGPAGLINGPFSVTQVGPRTFEFGFPTQQLSGTYTVVLASSVKSASGYAVDANLNAGVDKLRQTAANATVPIVFNSTDTPRALAPNAFNPTGNTITSRITVNDDFPIQGLTVTLDITDTNDPALTAVLTTPSGRTITLFSGVGATGNQSNFSNTIFDDNAATPIANGGPPFFGRFKPQQTLFVANESSVGGANGTGVYTLKITNSSATNPGRLNAWSLTFQKPLTGTGLGETVADQTPLSFRIFTMDPTNPLASATWTSVGPASVGGDNSGRIGGLAVDPSDPSGNTVYVGGASGGVWKTTNFLTADAQGPTYIPLTDFGPTSAINVGGIAVFGRNNDPNQSIVFVATGEGDTGSPGVGFLRSTNGGATWTVLDSTDNSLSFAQRDHIFRGSTAFKVMVDPHLTPSGDVVVYAALSGNNGGLWRSLDSGNTWTNMRAGNATDVEVDPNSGPIDAFTNPTGNLQKVYAAFRGEGVYLSPRQGVGFTLMTGGIGDPLIQDPASTPPNKPITVNNLGVNPNGGNGRIVLAKPALFPSSDPNAALKNFIYQGFLYAVVVTPNDHLQGVYLTKDDGQNWTKLRIPTLNNNPPAQSAIPTNDTSKPDYDPLGNNTFAQGNYDVSLAVDPNNPNVIYLGGTRDGNPSGLIRIDSTGVSDPHAFFLADDRNDGGTLTVNSTDAVALQPNPPRTALPSGFDPRSNPTINLIRDPFNPLTGTATIPVNNTASFANSGAGVKWTPFDFPLAGSTDQHRVVAFRDPLTGATRLIFGDDQGVFTGVDKGDGTLTLGIGTADAATGSRNGNLQITQFYYGAVQPSTAAAQNAGFLITGQAQDDGSPFSDPNLLNNGNISWSGPEGDGTGVATDQLGSGTVYRYNWPCCGGNGTDFFQVNGVGRTNGLFAVNDGGRVGNDSEWPFVGGFNFAVNPVDNQGIVISSGAGRVFRTLDQGRNWNVIGDPSIFGGRNSPALAFGATETSPIPSGNGALDNFIYAGTDAGQVFVTANFTGGNVAATGANWVNINNGALANNTSPFHAFVTNPTRGSHEAYAVTSNGVYYIADSNPTSGSQWVNITGNLFSITQAPFGITSLTNQLLNGLSSIKADFRYAIPDNAANPTGATHPILYVGGDGGVFRSIDKGATWTRFPSATGTAPSPTPNPPGVGGGLPVAHVSDLSLSIGNIDPTPGRAVAQPGDPNLLVATTYGRGTFAIRLAPVVFPNLVAVDPNLPSPGSAVTTTVNGQKVTTVTVTQPFINGFSEQTAFGNVVRISLLDLSDLTNPVVIGGYDPAVPSTDVAANRTQSDGTFHVQINPNVFTSNGVKTIGIQATDASGTQGNIAILTFTLNAKFVSPGAPTPPTLMLAAPGPNPNYTNVNPATVTGVTDPGVQVVVTILTYNGAANGTALPAVTSDANGNFSVQLPSVPNGTTLVLQAVATNTANNLSSASSPFSVTVKTSGPTVAPTLQLLAADDTGVVGDNLTSRRVTHVTGVTEPNATVSVYATALGSVILKPRILLSSGLAGPDGTFTIQLPAENDGTVTLQAQATDAAGNPPSPISPSLTLTFVTVLADYNGANKTTPSLYRRNDNGSATWLIQGAPNVQLAASANDIPVVGDFDGDGLTDLARYRPSSGAFFISRTRAGGETVSVPGANVPGSLPVVGDFDGDGKTDVGLYDPARGLWTLVETTNGGPTSVTFNNPARFQPQAGDIPVPDGYDDTLTRRLTELAVYRPSTGEFFIKTGTQANGTDDIRIVKLTTGTPGDVPVPANYHNTTTENFTRLAVFNPTTGVYLVQGDAPLQFNPGDIPAPGDYNGQGQVLPAAYRPSINAFAIVNVGHVPFGTAGDIPVTAPLVYRNLNSPPPALSLTNATPAGSDTTTARRPNFAGKTDPGALVDLINGSGAVVNRARADAGGNFAVGDPNPLPNGLYSYTARAHTPVGGVGPASPALTVRVATPRADYAGVSKAQPALFARSGASITWFVQNVAGLNGKQFSTARGDVPIVGDFLGSGRDQLAIYTPSTGNWALSPGGTILTNFGTTSIGSYVPVPADYNGNGIDVPAVYETTSGIWYVAGQPPTARITTYMKGDIPVPGNYDNSGKAGLALYRPSNQTWYINGPFGVINPIGFGGAGDIPVPGAYFTTATNLAVWRPSTGQYFIRTQLGGTVKAQFAKGDIPAPADYNGDGITDAAVFRPSTGQFLAYLNPNDKTARVVTTQAFGLPGYVPVTAPYQYRAVPGTTPFIAKASVPAARPVSLNLGSTAQTFAAPVKSLTPAPAATPFSAAASRSRPLQAIPATVATNASLRTLKVQVAAKKGV